MKTRPSASLRAFCTMSAVLLMTPGAPHAGALLTPLPAYRYDCQGTDVLARFERDSVVLRLDDGPPVTLPRRRAASGARFASADETLVFWDRGTRALLQRGAGPQTCIRVN